MVSKYLAEVTLRVNDLERMGAFYEDAVGLSVFKRFEDVIFFATDGHHAGHHHVLSLFHSARPSNYPDQELRSIAPGASTLHHFALAMGCADFDAERQRLTELGLGVEYREHPWVSWKSLYFLDPEENVVEFVSYDPQIVGSGQ